MADMLNSETHLRIADLEALRSMLIELLTRSQSPSGDRECQAWSLLADAQQLLSAAMINLSGGLPEASIDLTVYSGEEADHKLYVKLYQSNVR